jgi:hypothetical protein
MNNSVAKKCYEINTECQKFFKPYHLKIKSSVKPKKNVHVADFAVSLPLLCHFSCSIYWYSFEEIMFVFTFYRNVIYAFCNNDACVNKVNILVYGA